MKRLPLILSVDALLMAASSRAQADYEIIRWTSGFCEILNRSLPIRPPLNDYKPGRQKFKTFEQALAFKMQLLRTRQCTF